MPKFGKISNKEKIDLAIQHVNFSFVDYSHIELHKKLINDKWVK